MLPPPHLASHTHTRTRAHARTHTRAAGGSPARLVAIHTHAPPSSPLDESPSPRLCWRAQILSIVLGSLPAYFFGVWFTENVFAQKPLVVQATCPNCNYLQNIYFGDLFSVMTDGMAGPAAVPGVRPRRVAAPGPCGASLARCRGTGAPPLSVSACTACAAG